MSYKSKYTGPQIDDILDSVEGKQNEIEDLDSIRAGAAKGATALQSYTEKYTGTVTGIKINGETKSGSGVIDLGTISTDISGKVDKVAGKQLSTEDFTTALKTKLEGLDNYDDTELSNALSTLRGDFDELVSGDTTTAIKTFNEVIAFLDGLTDTQDLESIIASIEQQIAGKMDKVTLAAVATSGSYNDLTNKPTIPSAVTESTVSGWGFTKNAGTYSKPSGGIPKSDLASAVQTSLGKADTALQSYIEQYQGTVQSVETSETLDEVNTTTYVKYVAQTLTDAQKAQARANIGAAAVGEGGGGTTSSGSGAYSEVNHGTNDTTFTLTPNTFHVWDEVSELTLTLGNETTGVANEFVFQFTSGSEPTALTLPNDIKWANDSAPTIVENKIYQISVLRGLAVALEFNNSISVFPVTLSIGDNGDNGKLVFDYAVSVANGSSLQFMLNEGDIVINGESCTEISVSQSALTMHNRITLLTPMHSSDGMNCYYLYDSGILEIYVD